MPMINLRCECGKPAILIMHTTANLSGFGHLGSGSIVEIDIPLCVDCYRLELESEYLRGNDLCLKRTQNIMQVSFQQIRERIMKIAQQS